MANAVLVLGTGDYTSGTKKMCLLRSGGVIEVHGCEELGVVGGGRHKPNSGSG